MCVVENEVTGTAQDRAPEQAYSATSWHDVSSLSLISCFYYSVLWFVGGFNVDFCGFYLFKEKDGKGFSYRDVLKSMPAWRTNKKMSKLCNHQAITVVMKNGYHHSKIVKRGVSTQQKLGANVAYCKCFLGTYTELEVQGQCFEGMWINPACQRIPSSPFLTPTWIYSNNF